MGILSSIFGAGDLKKANKQSLVTQTAANNKAMAEYDPFKELGGLGLQAYRDAIGLGDGNRAIAAFEASPLYRLQYDAAMKAGQTGTAGMGNAAGMRNSGRTLMALQDNARDVTNRTFGQYVDPLSSTSNIALGIADKRAGLHQNLGQINSNYFQNKGQIKAGQWAGFDSLLGDALKFVGSGGFSGFGAGTGGIGLRAGQTFGELTGRAQSVY